MDDLARVAKQLGTVSDPVHLLEGLFAFAPVGFQIYDASGHSVVVNKAFRELFLGFALAMLTGISCVYLVLLLLFNSPTQPLTLLAAVPLCGGGAQADPARRPALGPAAVVRLQRRSQPAHP